MTPSAVIPESAVGRLSGIFASGPIPKMPDRRWRGFRHDQLDGAARGFAPVTRGEANYLICLILKSERLEGKTV